MVQIISRAGWGSTWSHPGAGSVRPADRRGVIIHHSVTAEGGDRASVSSILRQIERLDRDVNKWSGSYNYAVDHSGAVYELTGLSVVGTHASGHNTAYWGVCYIGDGRYSFPKAAGQSIRALITWLESQAGHPLEVLGHGQVNSTECPGPLVRSFLEGDSGCGDTGLVADGTLGSQTIRALQDRLRERGYYTGPSDGVLDTPSSATVAALQRYLNDKGANPALIVDGAGLLQTGVTTKTNRALQVYLGTPADGVLDAPVSAAVRRLQARLADGSF